MSSSCEPPLDEEAAAMAEANSGRGRRRLVIDKFAGAVLSIEDGIVEEI